MKIFHICSDYSKQALYNNLLTSISEKGVGQTVYVPVRSEEEIGKYRNQNLTNIDYKYSHILNKTDRLLYFKKIRKVESNILQDYAMANYSMIHAHFLFSDGGVAYNLHKKFKIPYVVAVRNTDLNIFFKYFIHLRKFALEILSNADQIIFLSPKYKEFLLENYVPIELRKSLKSKMVVIPNGVNDFWLDGQINEKKTESFIRFLYIGDFTKNKNIPFTIKGLKKIKDENLNLQFDIVGSGGEHEERVMSLIEENKSWINYHGRIHDQEKLKSIYNSSHIFVMPSRTETFGVVYIEALSQGLPVIYTEGQGIDGFYPEGEIGYAVKYNDLEDFIFKIKLIIENYSEMSAISSQKAKKFSWDKISDRYIEIYHQICKKKID